MSRESVTLVLGLVVLLTPFTGIPSSWKHYIFVVSGVFIIILSYQLRRGAYLRSIERNGELRADAFAERETPVHRVDAMPRQET